MRRAALAIVLVACSVPAPRIASISPDHGPVGSSATITGEYFCQQIETKDPIDCESVGSVQFDTIAAALTTYSDTEIIVEVPSANGEVDVTISVDGRVSNGVTFTIR